MPPDTDTWLTIAPQWLGALATLAAVIAAVWIARKQTAISDQLVRIEQIRDRAAKAANLFGYVDYAGENDTERVLYVLNTGGEKAADVEVILDGHSALKHPLVQGVRRDKAYEIPNFVDPRGKIKIRLVTPDDYIHVRLDLRWRSDSTSPNGEYWSDVIQVYPVGR